MIISNKRSKVLVCVNIFSVQQQKYASLLSNMGTSTGIGSLCLIILLRLLAQTLEELNLIRMHFVGIYTRLAL